MPLSSSHHLTITTTLWKIIFSKMAAADFPIPHALLGCDSSHQQGKSHLAPWAYEFGQACEHFDQESAGKWCCVTSEAGWKKANMQFPTHLLEYPKDSHVVRKPTHTEGLHVGIHHWVAESSQPRPTWKCQRLQMIPAFPLSSHPLSSSLSSWSLRRCGAKTSHPHHALSKFFFF